MEEYAKEIGMSGLAYLKVTEENTLKGSLDKYLTDQERSELFTSLELKPNDTLFIISDKRNVKICWTFKNQTRRRTRPN